MSSNMTELLRKVDVTLAEAVEVLTVDVRLMEAVLDNIDPQWDGYYTLLGVKQRMQAMRQVLGMARKDVEIVE